MIWIGKVVMIIDKKVMCLWRNIGEYGMKTNTVNILLKEEARDYWLIISHGSRYRTFHRRESYRV